MGEKRQSKYRQRRAKESDACHTCGKVTPFNWKCRCGFAICQDCMYKNVWGMSCNNITWFCPDCGQQNGFGNQ